jgi:hypothetical protein
MDAKDQNRDRSNEYTMSASTEVLQLEDKHEKRRFIHPMVKEATEGKGWKLELAGKKNTTNIVTVTGRPAGRAHWDRSKAYSLPARMELLGGHIDVLLRHGGDFLIIQPVGAIGKFHQERFFRIPPGTDESADMRDYAVEVF